MLNPSIKQHGTLLVNNVQNYTKPIIAREDKKLGKKFTKTEKKFVKWLENGIKRKKKGFHIFDNKKWITATQEELAKLFDVSRVTIWTAIKRLEKIGIIERLKMEEKEYGEYYRDHTYSYTLKESKIISSDAKNLTNNINHNKNNKLFLLINHDIGKTEREIPQEVPEKTNTDIINLNAGTNPEVTVREMYDTSVEILGTALFGRLDKKIAAWIGQARNKYFQTMEKWRSFLYTIKRSPYLMGSKFYLTLKWLLKFDTIAKILRGKYESFEEIKKREAERWNKRLVREMEEKKEMEKMELLTKSEEGLREIQDIEEPQKCKTARFNLFMKIGYPSYKSWFKEVKFVEENGKVILETASSFKYDWIGNRFREVLENLGLHLRKVLG